MPYPFLVSLISFFIISGNNFEVPSKSDKISWAKSYHLKWSDFQAPSKKSSTLDAYTMLGISCEVVSQKNGQVELGVFGYFEKSKSWVKDGEQSDYLLKHEQKHFDLCEVYRRKLVKLLEIQNPYDPQTFSEKVGSSFDKIFKDYTSEQERYDQETNHSQNQKAQTKWNIFIKNELEELEHFSRVAAKLKLK